MKKIHTAKNLVNFGPVTYACVVTEGRLIYALCWLTVIC